jgi:hypothetical protein
LSTIFPGSNKPDKRKRDLRSSVERERAVAESGK